MIEHYAFNLESKTTDPCHIDNLLFKYIEVKMFRFLLQSMNYLSNCLPGFNDIVASSMKQLQYMMNIDGDDNCEEEYKAMKKGMLNVHLCVNATTKEFHTKPDATMTIISVPPQCHDTNSTNDNYASHRYNSKYGKSLPQFQFALTKNETLIIPLKQYTTIAYSGYMLNHRQICDHVGVKKDFINIASYGNKRLFHNVVKSCKRNIGID